MFGDAKRVLARLAVTGVVEPTRRAAAASRTGFATDGSAVRYDPRVLQKFVVKKPIIENKQIYVVTSSNQLYRFAPATLRNVG